MELQEVLGWGSPIGLGICLLGLGVFFWGLHFHKSTWSEWKHRAKDE
jgi:hypothetical protein